MRRTFRLLILFWRQALMREMAYPGNFWFIFFVNAAGFVSQLLAIEIIFAQTDTLTGWSKGEALALFAIVGIVWGILRSLFEQSFLRFCADVHMGTFDIALVRPIDARVILSFNSLAFQHMSFFAFNLFLLVFLILRGMIVVTFPTVFGFLILLAFGLVIGYCFWFALTLFAFWAPTIEHFGYLYGVVLGIVRFPLDVYGRAARKFFLTLLPIGFIVSVPTEFLLGMGTWNGIIIALGVTMLVWAATQWWWRFAVRHYSSASS